MGPMRLTTIGPWVHLTGEPTPASHHPHQDGIFVFSMRGGHLVLKREADYMVLQRLQTVEKVGAGLEGIIYPLISILVPIELGHFLLVHRTCLRLSSGPRR